MPKKLDGEEKFYFTKNKEKRRICTIKNRYEINKFTIIDKFNTWVNLTQNNFK